MTGRSMAQLFHEDDICAICQFPLRDQPTLTLTCGHVWHHGCLQEQLRHAVPNPARRLVFSGLRCSLCGAVCQHPALDSQTRPSAELSERVDALILAQAAVDNLSIHPAVRNPHGAFHNDVLGYGRTYYAFFLCAHCEKPYLGGTVECADDADVDLPPDDRLCQTCSPRGSAICVDPVHAAYHKWKCRLCCRPATFICFGNTHLCDLCHDRETRVRAQVSRSIHGLISSPEPCPGNASCTSSLQPGQKKHQNGPDAWCEQLLQCAWCDSMPVGSRAMADARLKSRNLLFNGDAQHDLQGWVTDSRGTSLCWHVEETTESFRPNGRHFVCSYEMTTMGQCVDMQPFLRDLPNSVVEVSCRVHSRTDCPGIVGLYVTVMNAEHEILEETTSGIVTAPADSWEELRHAIVMIPNARFLVVLLIGRDVKSWRGDYGPKVAEVAVRVVFDEADENLDASRDLVDERVERLVGAGCVGPKSAVRETLVQRKDTLHRLHNAN